MIRLIRYLQPKVWGQNFFGLQKPIKIYNYKKVLVIIRGSLNWNSLTQSSIFEYLTSLVNTQKLNLWTLCGEVHAWKNWEIILWIGKIRRVIYTQKDKIKRGYSRGRQWMLHHDRRRIWARYQAVHQVGSKKSGKKYEMVALICGGLYKEG